MSADNEQVLDRAVLADDRPQFDRALNASLACDGWIEGLHFVEEVGFREVRDQQRLGGCWARRNDWRNAVADAVDHLTSAIRSHVAIFDG